MQIKKVVKRLVALGAGATMLGATVMGAMAADLSSYPGKFQTDGVFNGYFVVGESAKPIDNLAMTDIATSMWYTRAGSGSTVTLEGDAWKVGTSTNMLELKENIYDISNYLDSNELDALADGSITNNKGTARYEQFLYFEVDSNTTNNVQFTKNDDEKLAFFYYIDDGQQIARYYMDFAEALQSDWDSTNYWKDLKDRSISMLGQTYDIVKAENTSTGPKLTLMGGSTKGTLNEGESQNFMLGGKEYKVNLMFTNADNKAKFTINGEQTNLMATGETDKLSDGTLIGVSEVLYQAYAGGIHKATFFIGADKVVLQNGSSLVVGDKSFSEAVTTISYSESSSVLSIDSISINFTADDDFYVPVGGKLRDVMKYPEALIGNWDIEFKGVDIKGTEEVKISPYSGDEKYKLDLTTSAGMDVSIPLLYSNSSQKIFGGEKDGYELVLNASNNITRNNYFVLNTADASSKDGNSKTYVVQYKGMDACGDTDAKARFTILGGESVERSVATAGTFDLKIGGQTFNFAANGTGCPKNGAINLTDTTLNGYTQYSSGDSLGVYMRTKNNALITVVDVDNTNTSVGWTINVTVDDTSRMNTLATAQSTYYTFAVDSSYDIDATVHATDRPTYWQDNPDNDREVIGYDLFGTKVLQSSPSSGSKTVTWSIPSTQAEALLFVTSGATSSTVIGGELALVQVVDATRLDSEVSSVSAQNLIVVGGPCVNSVAATLLGNPADCAEGFSPGKARIKMFDNGANLAMLVAGYSGEDTRLAGKVVAHRWKELKGSEVEVAGTTYSDATIGAPTVVTTVVEETVEEETE